MKNITQNSNNFSSYATQTYATKKEAVDFLENSLDPWEKALGTIIKKYAGVEVNA
ncbi:hypothetical protein [Methanosarcina mazei]|uniref:hypothetical protein n=1 Tax=Methanosarcina mazei TaxID=2209 RepID=UPI000B2142B3|nr:hypothetical protein [Methanosarcina mazei]